MKKIFFLFLSILSLSANSQNIQHTCGFDNLLSANPALKEQLIIQTENWKNQYKQQALRRNYIYTYDTTYIVKVVFHILYNNNAENIPDTTILSQIEVLNEDFRRLNADTTLTRDEFKGVAGGFNIKFELATIDPSGMPTTGITRKSTTINAFDQTGTQSVEYDSRMKYTSQGGTNAWNTQQYLNIWVCDMYPQGASSYTAGYATPPNDAPYWNLSFPDAEQGVAIHYNTIGRYNSAAASNGRDNKGRTLTHELGHYFGLLHTWGFRSTSCNTADDDFLDDTPNTFSSSSGCNYNRNSCTDAQNDLKDQIENYMDYSLGRCQNMFSKQQASLMHSNLINYRRGIYRTEVAVDSIVSADANVTPRILFNPNNVLNVAADVYSKTTFSVEIFDIAGRSVFEKTNIMLNKPIDLQQTDLLQNGHYVVRITNLNNNDIFNLRWSKTVR